MNSARHHSEANVHVDSRIQDLLRTSYEIRAARRPKVVTCEVGLVARARYAVGRRLITIGGVVAGRHAGQHA